MKNQYRGSKNIISEKKVSLDKGFYRGASHNGFKFEKVGNNLNEFYKNTLPFELTGDQKKVIKEIRNDFLNGKPSGSKVII